MKKKLSKKEAKEKIDEFFSQKGRLDYKCVKKMKRLAMRHGIKLGKYRRKFCKKCFNDLRDEKVRVTKTHKTVECKQCGEKNRSRLDS